MTSFRVSAPAPNGVSCFQHTLYLSFPHLSASSLSGNSSCHSSSCCRDQPRSYSVTCGYSQLSRGRSRLLCLLARQKRGVAIAKLRVRSIDLSWPESKWKAGFGLCFQCKPPSPMKPFNMFQVSESLLHRDASGTNFRRVSSE